MNSTTPTPILSSDRETRIKGIGVAIIVVVVFVGHVLILQPPLPPAKLFAYTLLSLVLTAIYALGTLRMLKLYTRHGISALWPGFCLVSGLFLAIAVLLWDQGQLYFHLFIFMGYVGLAYYTSKRRWAIAFVVGTAVFAWLCYAVSAGWQAAGPALLDDLPWYGLTVIFCETILYRSENSARITTLLAELEQAYRQLQDHTAQAEALAVAQERNRLAREIHDTLGHTLTALDVQLELLARLPPGQAEQRQQAAEHARALVKQGLTDARRAVQALRPAALETFSLSEAIAGLAADFEQTTQIRTAWQVEGEITPLPPRLAVPLYRAAQEALTNVQRHAPAAQRVTLQLRYGPEAVTLSVKNTLSTFPPTGRIEGGHGLRGLRERAAALGGAFNAGPDEGGSFKVEMHLPNTPN